MFKDRIQMMPGKIGNSKIYLALEKGHIYELIDKYLGAMEWK